MSSIRKPITLQEVIDELDLKWFINITEDIKTVAIFVRDIILSEHQEKIPENLLDRTLFFQGGDQNGMLMLCRRIKHMIYTHNKYLSPEQQKTVINLSAFNMEYGTYKDLLMINSADIKKEREYYTAGFFIKEETKHLYHNEFETAFYSRPMIIYGQHNEQVNFRSNKVTYSNNNTVISGGLSDSRVISFNNNMSMIVDVFNNILIKSLALLPELIRIVKEYYLEDINEMSPNIILFD